MVKGEGMADAVLFYERSAGIPAQGSSLLMAFGHIGSNLTTHIATHEECRGEGGPVTAWGGFRGPHWRIIIIIIVHLYLFLFSCLSLLFISRDDSQWAVSDESLDYGSSSRIESQLLVSFRMSD